MIPLPQLHNILHFLPPPNELPPRTPPAPPALNFHVPLPPGDPQFPFNLLP